MSVERSRERGEEEQEQEVKMVAGARKASMVMNAGDCAKSLTCHKRKQPTMLISN